MRVVLQNGAEILVDDFDPEAHAQQTLVQKAEEARNHAARMLRQTKVCHCATCDIVDLFWMFGKRPPALCGNGLSSCHSCCAVMSVAGTVSCMQVGRHLSVRGTSRQLTLQLDTHQQCIWCARRDIMLSLAQLEAQRLAGL